jgi:hypothetical protein
MRTYKSVGSVEGSQALYGKCDIEKGVHIGWKVRFKT